MTTSPTLHVFPQLKTARKGKAQTLDVLVALRAPQRKQAAERPSLNLALVIDNSGSMSGQPLEEAKRAAASLVHGLQDNDRVAIVVYADQAVVVLPSMTAEAAKQQVDARLAEVRTQGCTALQAGWLAGAEQIAPFVSQYGISRVLLLSDGNANIGEHRPEALADIGRKMAQAGITTSTYGIGSMFNETLMTAIAQASQGMASYAQNADGLATYFANEFAMLCDLAGKNVRLQVIVTDENGKALEAKCLNELDAIDGQVRLPALLSGAESWAVFAIELTAEQADGAVRVQAQADYQDVDGRAFSQKDEAIIKFGARAGKMDVVVNERAKEARAAIMAREAREAAMQGDLLRRDTLIRNMSSMAGNNAYVAGVANTLADVAASGDMTRFAKEAFYSSTSMSMRVAEANEDHTVLAAGRYGLRKAAQGEAVKGEDKAGDAS